MRTSVFCILIFSAVFAHAQELSQKGDPFRIQGLHLGVGAGIDVAGLVGGRLTYWPIPQASVFVGGGWMAFKEAWSYGAEIRIPTRRLASPFVTAMHGANAAVVVRGRRDMSRLYYGNSIGAGIMLRQRNNRNYWRFAMYLPFRSQKFYDYREMLLARPNIEKLGDVYPITVSIGVHLCLWSRR